VKHIYISNPNLQYWFEETGVDGNIVNDLDVWLSLPSNECVALWETQDFGNDTESELEKIVSHASKALVFLPEFIDDHWCKKFDRPNVVFYIAGILNWTPGHSQVKFHYYFFWSTTDFYHTQQNWLPKVSNVLPKDKFFDVLLGRRKVHRSMVYDSMDHSQNIVTYYPTNVDLDLRNYSSSQFIWPVDLPENEITFTGSEVVVDSTIVSLSQLVPIDVYNHSAYSLIAETQSENSFSFFTEKIIKPMMCRRLFVVAGGQYYLHNLRKLGFQTFHGIIDESYDSEPDISVRVKLMLEQVAYLQTQEQAKIYQLCQPIVEHNYDLTMKTAWVARMIADIKSTLDTAS